MKNKTYLGFHTGELRAKSEGGTHTIEGLAIPYGKWSQPIYNYFVESFARGAFTEHLKTDPDVICTINHNPQYLTGRSSADTLKLEEKSDGVFITNKLPNTTYVKDLLESVERKDIRGMSFIFTSEYEDETWLRDGDKLPQRTINKAKLFEVTYTAIPAYADTDIALRSGNLATADDFKKRIDAITKKTYSTADAEKKLRQLGIM